MGELQHEPFQFAFNGFLKVAFHGSRVTSDAGLILVRELDERLGLETLIAEHLSDSRQGLNTQFSLADLLRQSVYSRLAGYEDLNDAVRVSADPTFRLIGSPKMWDRGAALTSTLHWFETELLTQETNLVGLRAVNRAVLAQAEMVTRADRIVLDMDSSESPVHGAQEGSAYNGHFASVCYHPLFLFTEHGDCVAATLRPGNVHSADDWDDLLVPEIERQQAEGKRVAFRADAAFAKPEIYDALEQRDVDYAIRMPGNKCLELEIEGSGSCTPTSPRLSGTPVPSLASLSPGWPCSGGTSSPPCFACCSPMRRTTSVSQHVIVLGCYDSAVAYPRSRARAERPFVAVSAPSAIDEYGDSPASYPGFPICWPQMAPLYTREPPSARNSVRRTIVQLQRPSFESAPTFD